MLARIFILLVLGGSGGTLRIDCGGCEENTCNKCSSEWVYATCYWNSYSNSCVNAEDQRVDCGKRKTAPDCGSCGSIFRDRDDCGGECHWLEEANYCVHTAVHMAPPFLSLSSSGIAGQKFPEAMGVYELSQTTRDSHHLVGYRLRRDFYLFKDYSKPASEFVTKVPFSKSDNNVILFHNESGWFMKIQRLNGKVEFVKDQSVTLEPMQTREEHDCQFGAWQEGPCSLTCGGGVKVLTREILREARGHGACAGETEDESACNIQPCDLPCLWSDWREEAACTKSCGGGTKTLRRNIVRNNSGNGLPCAAEDTRLEYCNDFLCPDVLAAIVIPTLLLVLTIISLGVLYFTRKYNILENNGLPMVSFNMPNIIKITK